MTHAARSSGKRPVMIIGVQYGWSDSGRWDGKELIRLQCPNGGRRTVLDPELLKQVLDMLFHGAGAHLRDLADFGVGLAASEPGQHLSLASRETELLQGRSGDSLRMLLEYEEQQFGP